MSKRKQKKQEVNGKLLREGDVTNDRLDIHVQNDLYDDEN